MAADASEPLPGSLLQRPFRWSPFTGQSKISDDFPMLLRHEETFQNLFMERVLLISSRPISSSLNKSNRDLVPILPCSFSSETNSINLSTPSFYPRTHQPITGYLVPGSGRPVRDVGLPVSLYTVDMNCVPKFRL